ncbi:hypothetical protein Tco_1177338, partial [Tanacetum coccineum]
EANKKSTSETKEKCKKKSKSEALMAGVHKYNEQYVKLFEDVCTGREYVGDRSKRSFWNGFARRFNGIIESGLAEAGVAGQERVNFTGEDCRIHCLFLRRYNKLKILLAPENARLAEVFNFRVPTMSFSKSNNGTSTGRSGRSTAASGRMFSSEDVLNFSSQMRRTLVMEILTNLDGLDPSDVLKVNS